jgi:hypothetical protein
MSTSKRVANQVFKQKKSEPSCLIEAAVVGFERVIKDSLAHMTQYINKISDRVGHEQK